MTREELSVLGKITKEIEQLKRELENVDHADAFGSDSVTGSDTEFPYTQHQIMITGYDYSIYASKVKRIQNRLNRKLQELMDEKDRITEYIYSLNDSDLRQILMYKYVNGLTWSEIGANMNYDESTVRKKHNKWFAENSV